MAFYHHQGAAIKYLFALVDFITYNSLFISMGWMWRLRQPYPEHDWRLAALAFNLALVPAIISTLSTHASHTVMMEKAVTASLKGIGIHALFFLAILNVTGSDFIPPFYLACFYSIAFVVVSCANIISRTVLKAYRLKGGNIMQVVIVGSGETARRLAMEMTNNDSFGYNIRGFFSTTENTGSFSDGITRLGNLKDLDSYLENNNIDEVYYSCTDDTPANIEMATKASERHMARFYFVPPLGHWSTRNFHVFTIGSGIPALSVHRNPLDHPVNRFLKRIFDIVFSASVLLILAVPVFIPIAIGVRLSSKGPVFFRQKRTGYRGNEFTCLKFRSMYVNKNCDTQCATRNDMRVTAFGRMLRRFSIDELPQFWNTLVGDMSVVGPRPHMCSMNDRYSSILSGYMVRHMIKPGITGWAQVNGLRGNADDIPQIKRRVEHDVWYMDHWSFILDLKIIARTFYNILSGRDENAF